MSIDQQQTGNFMKDFAASAVKAAPPLGANWWFWFTSHDINWWVALATLIYIGLQSFYLVRNKGMRD
jgi:hypothetical protein